MWVKNCPTFCWVFYAWADTLSCQPALLPCAVRFIVLNILTLQFVWLICFAWASNKLRQELLRIKCIFKHNIQCLFAWKKYFSEIHNGPNLHCDRGKRELISISHFTSTCLYLLWYQKNHFRKQAFFLNNIDGFLWKMDCYYFNF